MTTETRLARLESPKPKLKRWFVLAAVCFVSLLAVAAAAPEKPVRLDADVFTVPAKDGKPAIEMTADGIKTPKLEVGGKDVMEQVAAVQKEIAGLKKELAESQAALKKASALAASVESIVIGTGDIGGIQVGLQVGDKWQAIPVYSKTFGSEVIAVWYEVVGSPGELPKFGTIAPSIEKNKAIISASGNHNTPCRMIIAVHVIYRD